MIACSLLFSLTHTRKHTSTQAQTQYLPLSFSYLAVQLVELPRLARDLVHPLRIVLALLALPVSKVQEASKFRECVGQERRFRESLPQERVDHDQQRLDPEVVDRLGRYSLLNLRVLLLAGAELEAPVHERNTLL